MIMVSEPVVSEHFDRLNVPPAELSKYKPVKSIAYGYIKGL